MKLVYQYMTFFFNFSLTSSHLYPLQVENCDSNSRLVVDKDDNGKFRLERVKSQLLGVKCVFKHEDFQMFDILSVIWTGPHTSAILDSYTIFYVKKKIQA